MGRYLLLTSFLRYSFDFAVQSFEKVIELAHGLGGAEEEKSARFQCVVEEGDEFLLQFPVHIDHHVATTDQVKFGERWVFDNVLFGKDYHVTDSFLDVGSFRLNPW